ncbi:MAG: hypothetical protein JWN86_1702 [Planctomycetota bacterium]|nr:hypothetical protein [Planctomycetota bacterium]
MTRVMMALSVGLGLILVGCGPVASGPGSDYAIKANAAAKPASKGGPAMSKGMAGGPPGGASKKGGRGPGGGGADRKSRGEKGGDSRKEAPKKDVGSKDVRSLNN